MKASWKWTPPALLLVAGVTLGFFIALSEAARVTRSFTPVRMEADLIWSVRRLAPRIWTCNLAKLGASTPLTE
jgi:hypothetical protein